MSADGLFTYTPFKGFSGTDSFTYTDADIFGRTAKATVTFEVSLSGEVLGRFAAGKGPDAITFDGSHIWVANDDEPGTVTELNDSNGSLIGKYRVSQGLPEAITFDGDHIWVAEQGLGENAGNAYELNDSDGSVINNYFPLHGDAPNAIAPDRSEVWIVLGDMDEVQKEPGGIWYTPYRMYPDAIAVDGNDLWVRTTTTA